MIKFNKPLKFIIIFFFVAAIISCAYLFVKVIKPFESKTPKVSNSQTLQSAGNNKTTAPVNPPVPSFSYEPFDKVFGSKGPKAILYVAVADSAFQSYGSAIQTDINFANKGFFQVAVRNLNAGWFVSLKNQDSLSPETKASSIMIVGYTNCMKIVKPESYFDYISSLGNARNKIDSFLSIQSVKSWLESSIPSGVPPQSIRDCVKNDAYEEVAYKDDKYGVSSWPTLVFPELNKSIVGILKTDTAMIDRLNELGIDTSQSGYKAQDANSYLQKALQ